MRQLEIRTCYHGAGGPHWEGQTSEPDGSAAAGPRLADLTGAAAAEVAYADGRPLLLPQRSLTGASAFVARRFLGCVVAAAPYSAALTGASPGGRCSAVRRGAGASGRRCRARRRAEHWADVAAARAGRCLAARRRPRGAVGPRSEARTCESSVLRWRGRPGSTCWTLTAAVAAAAVPPQ